MPLQHLMVRIISLDTVLKLFSTLPMNVEAEESRFSESRSYLSPSRNTIMPARPFNTGEALKARID